MCSTDPEMRKKRTEINIPSDEGDHEVLSRTDCDRPLVGFTLIR